MVHTYLSSETWCVAEARKGTSTLHSFYAWCFEKIFSRCWIGRGSPTYPALLPQPPCSLGLTTLDNSMWGSIKGRVAVCVTTPPTKSCAELWKMPFKPLLHKCSGARHRGHGGIYACMTSIKAHIQIHQICNQKVYKWFKLIMIDYDWTLIGVLWLLSHSV